MPTYTSSLNIYNQIIGSLKWAKCCILKVYTNIIYKLTTDYLMKKKS